jgi:hypothetical protein
MTDDENRRSSFGPQEKPEGIWDKYIGSYIKIKNPGNAADCMGKLVGILEGNTGMLIPFLYMTSKDDTKKLIFIEEGLPETTPLFDRPITPTTRERLEEEIEYINKNNKDNKKGSFIITSD